MKQFDTGILLNEQNIKLHRSWFKQMTKLVGLNVCYQSPIDTADDPKEYSDYGELHPTYGKGRVVGCIFDEHPSQKTMRMLGWNAEMAETTTVIHVPYDLPGLQAGRTRSESRRKCDCSVYSDAFCGHCFREWTVCQRKG